MQSWTSRCRATALTPRRQAVPLLALLALLAVFAGRAEAAPWYWAPSIGAAAGYENDSVVDPNLGRATVPGGSFLDVSPGLSTTTFLNRRTRLRITGQAVLEHFLNEENRTLLGTTLTGDVLARSGDLGHLRLSLAGTYYSDSEIETAERFGGGLEVAAGFSRSLSWMEVLGGVLAREYPNLAVSTTAGGGSTYAEGTMRLGVQGGLALTERITASGLLAWHKTNSRDPAYDGTSWFLQGTVSWNLGARTFLEGTAIGQSRHFPSRSAEVDSDSYWQAGVGLRRVLSGKVALMARYAYASYSQAGGGEETIHRASLGMEWRFAGARTAPAEVFALPVADTKAPPLPTAGRHTFRVQAASARSVSVVGDFNGWDPGANPMTQGDDGWWECSLNLSPGSFQYAYRIDGRLVPPPESTTLVDDGFGGRNGVIRVVDSDG